jgi:hypothetical protein
MRHYIKEVVSNPVLDRNGKAIQWETIGQDYGILTLDENDPVQQQLIEDLDKLREQKTGGIVPCTEDEQRQKKLQYPWQPSVSPSEPTLRVFQDQLKASSRKSGVAEVSQPVTAPPVQPVAVTPTMPPAAIEEPPKVLTPKFKPRMGRVSRPTPTAA